MRPARSGTPLLRFLKTDLRWTLLVVGAGRLRCVGGRAGPLRRVDPLDVRQGWPLGGRPGPRALVGDRAGRGRIEPGRAARAAGSSSTSTACAIVGVIVAGLFLVFGGNLTGWGLLVIVIVLAVYLGLLQLVAAWARKVSDGHGAAGVGHRLRRRAGHLLVPARQNMTFAPGHGGLGSAHWPGVVRSP